MPTRSKYDRPLRWYVVHYAWTGQDGIAFKDTVPLRAVSSSVAAAIGNGQAWIKHPNAIRVRVFDVVEIQL